MIPIVVVLEKKRKETKQGFPVVKKYYCNVKTNLEQRILKQKLNNTLTSDTLQFITR